MGAFHIGCKVENHTDRTKGIRIPKLLVDTGSEYTWIPSSKLETIRETRLGSKIRFAFTKSN